MPRSRSNSDRSPSNDRHRDRSLRGDEQPCLYIGNIDRRVTQEQLSQLFGQEGQLDYCFIVYQPRSNSEYFNKGEPKISRGYGFAKYKHIDDAIRARGKLQDKDLNGRRIKIEYSKRDNPREPTPGRYLGKMRQSSPPRYHRRRSYSRSSSWSERDHKRKKHKHRHDHEKKKHRSRRSRSRSDSYQRRRHSKRSYSRDNR